MTRTNPASAAGRQPSGPALLDRARPSFRTDIEGLRAVAVVLVVLGHAGLTPFAGGYVGVDVFFVISGFLITSLLLRELATTGRIDIARFYARRAVRLLPAASLVLVVTLAGTWLWLSSIRLREFAMDTVAAAFYLSNVRFAITGTDYLTADGPPSPVQHFWSLAVEEQFYLVWPLLLIVTVWLGGRLAAPRALLGRRPATTAVVLAGLIAVSFALSITETARSAPWAYFGAHTRAWELGVGAMLALSTARLHRLPARAAAILSWTGLAAICVSCVLYDESTPYPGSAALLPVIGTAAVIAAGTAARRGGAATVLNLGPMQTVGRLSYGWYLWHWPMLMIGPEALGVTGSIPVNLVMCAGALLVAAVTFHLVENPVRHHLPLVRQPVRAIGLGVALSATVAAGAVVAAAMPRDLPVGRSAADLQRVLSQGSDPDRRLAELIAASDGTRLLPANLRPSPENARAEKPRVYGDGCHAEAPVEQIGAACLYGDVNGRRTMVLYGDSHAAHWFPALELLAQRHGWRLVSLTKSACVPADVQVWHSVLKRPYVECEVWRTHTLRRISELRPDLIVMGSTYNYRPAMPLPDEALPRWWSGGWQRTFSSLRSSGADVVTVMDTPRMHRNVPTCLTARPERVHVCATLRSKAVRDDKVRRILADLEVPAGVRIVVPVPWLCSVTCPPIIGNVLVYRDAHHLTAEFAQALVPLLERSLPGLRSR